MIGLAAFFGLSSPPAPPASSPPAAGLPSNLSSHHEFLRFAVAGGQRCRRGATGLPFGLGAFAAAVTGAAAGVTR